MTGQSIAHHTFTGKLGQGGMGEVYRPTDTDLDRDVAIKILPEAFARRCERLARFEREARAPMSSLRNNEPFLCSVRSLLSHPPLVK